MSAVWHGMMPCAPCTFMSGNRGSYTCFHIIAAPSLLVDRQDVGWSLVPDTRPLPFVGSIRPLPNQLSGWPT